MMLVRFFVVLVFLVAVLAVIICAVATQWPECTKYTISNNQYHFNVDNYSQTENSVTFQRGSTNITLVGNFAIYENNCSRGD